MLALLRDGLDLAAIAPANDASGALAAWAGRAMGLRGLRLDDPGVRFELAHPLASWAWALLVAAAVGLAILTYWRLQGRRRWRFPLAGLRALAIVLLLLLLTGPRLVRPNLATEPDWLVVLIDRSASMTIPDAPGPGHERQTRESQLARAIGAARPALDELATQRRILWLGFDASAYELPLLPLEPGRAPVPSLDEPTGRRTALAAALDDTLALIASRPVAGIVVLSDGRSVDQIGEGLRERLKRVDVFGVALGSPDPLPDLALVRVEAPGAAFVNDTVPVRVELERLGLAGAPPATVRVIDAATGLVLGEQRVEPEDLAAAGDAPLPITLTIRPTTPGEARWQVVVEPDVPDLIARNNRADLEIELVDRPLRVLYFDGYPRWEQRYIKNLLLREPSIRGTAMILSPDRRYAQDGDEPLASLPRTAEDWLPFDVVVLGDFRADLLSKEQAEALKQHVATRGAGVLWIAGPGALPSTWASSPLADLLPMPISPGEGGAEIAEIGQGVTLWRTPLAERLGVLELGDPDAAGLSPWPMAVSDPRTGWSILRWAQALTPQRLKATTEVLALGVPESAWPISGEEPLEAPGSSTLDSALPLVTSMRYGAGRVIYVATDEIWRWRYGRGEALTERFWIPFIRALGRDRLARTGQSAMLEITPRQARVDQPVRLVVRLLDQALVDRRAESVSLRVRRLGPTGDSTAAGVIRLAPESGDEARSAYAATWLATEPGRYRIEADDALLPGLAGEIIISHPDDELRRLETDHPLLASLSEPNAGRPLSIAELPELTDLPSRARTVEGEPDIET
ncbi:MAG: VWA domain-containing protein, partial [Thermomicrobiales bacterium]|nr:VWA domain-containing protein [Thermomicrobiales bacterium]